MKQKVLFTMMMCLFLCLEAHAQAPGDNPTVIPLTTEIVSRVQCLVIILKHLSSLQKLVFWAIHSIFVKNTYHLHLSYAMHLAPWFTPPMLMPRTHK